jgi:hypothetical protein
MAVALHATADDCQSAGNLGSDAILMKVAGDLSW